MNHLVELTGVERSFAGPPEVRALRGVNLRIAAGEMVAITGSSGSGKSTLLNILGLLDVPTKGQVVLDGTDATTLTERERTHARARRFGFVFQAFHLIAHMTVRQNVMLPLMHLGMPRRERWERAETALRQVGLAHRLDSRPATLSGGEQQRVAVARAVVHEPRLILCDEPTGNLDRANTANVLRLLRDTVTPTRAVVVVTHEDEVSAAAHRTVTVVDGRVD